MNEHFGNFCDYTHCKHCLNFICDNKRSNDCERNTDRRIIVASVLDDFYSPVKEENKMVTEQELQEIRELLDN